MKRFTKIILLVSSYIMVATLAASVTLLFFARDSKLDELQKILQTYYIGQTDATVLEDAAAQAMVEALGDRWSYYISASEYTSYEESKNNAYVGVGITIEQREDNQGFVIKKVENGGPAQEVGMQAGDIIIAVENQSVLGQSADVLSTLVRGEPGTQVTITVLRDDQTLTFTPTRKTIEVAVATGQMLSGNIGLVTIYNFNQKCASESIAAIDALIEQGAQALIFDVRNNPGGYVTEVTALLDYLVPSGVIFHSVDYTGAEEKIYSDEAQIDLPMAVLVNARSYSAAEYFAAVLEEYDKAVVVGEQTVGKSHFQVTIPLSDGSAVGLSIGKYFTPEGVSLAQVGGLVPDIIEQVDEKTELEIYAGTLAPENDPQVQAAVAALKQD